MCRGTFSLLIHTPLRRDGVLPEKGRPLRISFSQSPDSRSSFSLAAPHTLALSLLTVVDTFALGDPFSRLRSLSCSIAFVQPTWYVQHSPCPQLCRDFQACANASASSRPDRHTMFFSQPAHLVKAEELKKAPPKGTPYSVAIPGTEQPGRSRVYRAWNAQKELLATLDPQVCKTEHCDKVKCIK